jgi:DNA-binding response OmpR family regulator
MKKTFEGKRIFMIDLQESWCEAAASLLSQRNCLVKTSNAYSYSEPTCYVEGEAPDVVILGCGSVDRGEQQLIRQIVAHKRHLIVLCAVLAREESRRLFLAGAQDVAHKPFSCSSLLRIVGNSLAGQEITDCFRERMLRK